MAAPLRKIVHRCVHRTADLFLSNGTQRCHKINNILLNRSQVEVSGNKNVILRTFTSKGSSKFSGTKRAAGLLLGGSVAVGAAYYALRPSSNQAHASEGRPAFKPIRKIRRETDHSGLKLTLYQYQNCPFCCKVRAFLDYNGFSYDVIEVNSVTKKHIKWSEYKKVPMLVVECDDKEVVLRDSSVIVSILESHMFDKSTGLEKLNSYYPSLEEKVASKRKVDFPNKYFVMYQERTDLGTTPEQRNEERKWRKWTDDHLVHMLSPNAYRTVREALQAFNYFSDSGQWEENFSFVERKTVIYLGSAVMYVLGIVLKNKYKLKEDVRESLYDACNEWVKAVGKKRLFMGGEQPNLADLSVYGVLSSIEGCDAFRDTMQNSKIGPWFKSMQEAVKNCHGAHPQNMKAVS